MSFEPIAIVGRACVLPGALSPAELWQAVVEGRDLLGPAPDDRWGIAKERILTADPSRSDDACWSDRGGYVRGFEGVFDPNGFALAPDEVRALDPLFQWVLHTAREALRDGRFAGDPARVGAIFGNLSFPSSSMSRYAERVWLGGSADTVGLAPVDARNRFMSGLPAHVLAQALGLGAGAYALDAACASSLYAIKLACDALHDRRADAMLAGAVNRADDLFIHVGFCALNALSKRGRSTPFDAGADGLVPGEGAGFVLLKRLGDALRDGDTIHGVIRGVGLSNDGRGRGMLAPSEDGQVRAMRSAYAQAGLEPSSVQYVECHATGTPVGDATEIRSMGQVFGTSRPLPMGSLKANMGHLITAAGVGGLIKVLEALRHGVVPPTPHVAELNHAIAETGFRPASAPSAWPTEGVRRAAVSAFGFGGNNAHLVVEQLDPSMPYALPAPVAPVEIAIVGLGARVADGRSAEDFASVLAHGSSRVRPRDEAHVSAHADEVVLGLGGLRFPPNDLSQTLAQQTLLLAAAREAVDGLALPPERTSILVGSQCDPEVARYGARWRSAEWAAELGLGAEWLSKAREAFVPVLRSAGVLGTMPNIPANRMNSQFDLSGPSFTVASEELSGIRALEIAARWLSAGELDAAVVGAVDVASEPVHEASARALLGPGRQVAGDAAVVLVLKRLDDARRAGDPILAVIGEPDDTRPYVPFGVTREQSTLSSLVGDPHAATGLLHVLAAALAVGRGITPGGGAATDRARVLVESLLGQRALVCLRDEPGAEKPTGRPGPEGQVLRFPAHPATPVVPTLPVTSRAPMTQLMAPAPSLPPTHVDHVHAPVAASAPAPSAPAPVAVPAPARPLAPAPVFAPAALAAPAFAAGPVAGADSVYARFAAYQQQLAAMHQEFLAQQSAVHQQFLAMQQNALFGLAATATR
ncbi:MAG: beta-ketoacyl synthase N-terminal-like domain-containing protein, partial [Polyangiales bacterium]